MGLLALRCLSCMIKDHMMLLVPLGFSFTFYCVLVPRVSLLLSVVGWVVKD